MKAQDLSAVVGDVVRQMHATQDRCIVCGRMTRDAAIFIPKRSVDYGAPTGKERLIFYRVCNRHDRKDKGILAIIEEKLAEGVGIERQN